MRTIKHLLTRVINRIHLQIEISDYQIAAALLNLPSMIFSDRYFYGSPLALQALRANLSRIPPTDPSPLRTLCAQLPSENVPLIAGTTLQDMHEWTQDDLAETWQNLSNNKNTENESDPTTNQENDPTFSISGKAKRSI